ncbi:MAG: site-specific DNA-methyltransferase [Bacteroidaceae bacterium]|nr:site-specific DNA-methyltransferase [Bacteroidaceae bacterium]
MSENEVLDSVSRVMRGDVRYTLLNGDSAAILKWMPSESVNCIITSPPYWAQREYDISDEFKDREIGREHDVDAYVNNLLNVFKEAKRVLKKDGSLWLNLGDKYHNKALMGMPWRVALALMSDGWILRNDIIWDKMKGTQSCKDRFRDVYEHLFHFVKNTSYYYDADSIRVISPRKPKKVNGVMMSATGVSGKRYRKLINESLALSEEEKQNAMQALDETLEQLMNGDIVDFRMTIRGSQRTYHSDNTHVSGRAKELEQRGYFIMKMSSKGYLPSDIWRITPEDTWRKDQHYAVFPEELLINPIMNPL